MYYISIVLFSFMNSACLNAYFCLHVNVIIIHEGQISGILLSFLLSFSVITCVSCAQLVIAKRPLHLNSVVI